MKNYTDSLFEFYEAFSASQYPVAVQKMQDFNSGSRKENLKACGDQKLVDYYDICVSRNFNNAKAQIEVELKNRGMSSFINTTPLAANNQNTTAKYVYTANDFQPADAQFIKDNANDLATILANIFGTNIPLDEKLKLCISDIILALAIKEVGVATILKDTITNKVPVQEIKDAIKLATSDTTIAQRLADIRAQVTTANSNAASFNQPVANTQAGANTVDIIVNAQPGAAMYRLVTYNKDYNPPARQYLLLRKLDHATNKYHVGIEGSPRNTGDWAEPVFDSIQQAENFAKNVINLQTARNVANFKYSIVSKPFTGGTADLSDCTLVDTILGPAYIQNKSSYKESLSKAVIEEDIEKHAELNPKLWNTDNTLKVEVKEKIMQIVDDFCKGLAEDEIKFNLQDVKLVGSNCSYNYNKDSDLDIHLVMETGSLQCPDNLYPLLYSAYRSLYNNKLDIDFYGIPVEIFVETDDTKQLNEPVTEARQQTALKSNGIYSVMNDAWVKEPIAEDIPEVDKEAFEKELKVWEDEAKELLEDSKDKLNESLLESKEEDILKARSIIADQIRGEWDADKGYTKAAADLAELKDIDTKEAQAMMLDIASEEHVHVGELETAYDAFDSKLFDELEDGHNEADEKAEPANTLDYDIAEEPVASDLDIKDDKIEESLKESVESDQIEKIENYIERLYDLRKQSIAIDGEYGLGNLVFKELRNKGYLDNLREIKFKLKSKDLSLEEGTKFKDLDTIKDIVGSHIKTNPHIESEDILLYNIKNKAGQYISPTDSRTKN